MKGAGDPVNNETVVPAAINGNTTIEAARYIQPISLYITVAETNVGGKTGTLVYADIIGKIPTNTDPSVAASFVQEAINLSSQA